MNYTKAELHFHTAESSVCAGALAKDSIPFYKQNGYDLVVVTDHFNSTYFEGTEGCSLERWKRECERWFAGWYAAREAGERCGITVLHGAEFQLKGHMCELLVYGMTDEMFLETPRFFDLSVAELSDFAKKNGLFVAIAHPFRRQDQPDPTLYHGAEICNTRISAEKNEEGRVFAKEHNLIPICGQDFHRIEHMRGVMTRFNGEVRDNKTLVDKLFARDFELIIPDGEYKIAK